MKLSDHEIACWRKAGHLAASALQFGKPLIEPGVTLLSVVEKIEAFVHQKGGQLAFPINISINNIAAHDAPAPGDERVFSSQDLVKLDVGVHVDGYIGDNALTVDLTGRYGKLCDASRQALLAVVAQAKPGTRIGDLGHVVEKTIRSFGFLPVKNLGGHQMNVYNLHCGIFVPNHANNDKKFLEPGMVLAIEPFAAETCDGVKDGDDCYIFNIKDKSPKNLNEVEPTYSTIIRMKGLPFSLRDLLRKLPQPIVEQQAEALERQGLIHYYPPLVTKNGCMVTQHEHTVIVANPPIVTTLVN